MDQLKSRVNSLPTPTLCACGCGKTPGIVSKGDPKRGIVEGSPRKYASHRCYLNHRAANKTTHCPQGHEKTKLKRGQLVCRLCEIARRMARRYGVAFEDVINNPPPDHCELCGIKPSGDPWDVLNPDHCHKTNRFRGWICGNCNRGLGLFKDNLQLIRLAYRYLKERS